MGWQVVDGSVQEQWHDAQASRSSRLNVSDRDVVAELRRIMSSLLRASKTPSYAVGVFDAEGLLYSWGDALPDIAQSVPDEHSVFRIASMSKSFTAAAVLRLAEHGAIDLHAPLCDYLPEIRVIDAMQAGDQACCGVMSAHDVLSMVSGLVEDDAWADRQESMPRTTFLDLLAKGIRPAYPAGLHYAYSNLGYAILGELVHSVSGISINEYVNKHFLLPLNLSDTTYDWHEVEPNNLRRGYHRVATCAELGGWQEEGFSDPGAFSAIGGVLSTVRDMSRWCRWLGQPLTAAHSSGMEPCDNAGDTLSPQMRVMMQRGHTPIAPVLRSGDGAGRVVRTASSIESYGYGLVVEHDADFGDIAYHSGGYPGYGSHMRWHLDSGLGIVVLANGRYAEPGIQAGDALRMLLSVHGGVGRHISVWPQTWRAVDRVNDALMALAVIHQGESRHQGDETYALRSSCRQALGSLWTMMANNVVLDASLERRAQSFAEELNVTGIPRIFDDGKLHIRDCCSTSPANMSWSVDCAKGTLRCELAVLGLHGESNVQSLTLVHLPSVPTGTLVSRSAPNVVVKAAL